MWRKLYKMFVFNNDSLDQVLEDQSLYWNDDKEIVDTFVLKTIKRFEEKQGANQPLLPEFKDDEDQEFARRLFRRTILNADYYQKLGFGPCSIYGCNYYADGFGRNSKFSEHSGQCFVK